jgi:septal ring factor EnvC (AmiA/AmiB activator)
MRSLAPHVLAAFLIAGLMASGPLPTFAQSPPDSERVATEQRLQKLQQQIERDRERLSETAEAEEASRANLEKVKREIALREELAATYERRMRQLRLERDSLRQSLKSMRSRLDELKSEYQNRASHAYMYGRLHDIGLILAAQSINQMLIRARYLHRFAEERRGKLSDIQAASSKLQERQSRLDSTEARTEQLLAEVESEQERLRSLRNERQQLVSELRAQRSSLKEEIERKRSAAQQLESQIRRMIAAETARTEREATPRSREEYANLSASFEQNQGQLPWPADGVVIESYGNQTSDYGTTTHQPGILIATNPQEEVRCIFDGTITGIDFVPGYGTYLVVRHGDYLSVYSNFSMLYVSEGDNVSAGQVLGRAGTESEPRGAGVFFAVFDMDTNESVNPLTWLRDQ